MPDILYILPHDRPWFWNRERLAKRKSAYMPRVMFEVCCQIPSKYSVAAVDLNIELAKGYEISEVISEILKREKPKIVFISFCTFTQGEQLRVITDTICKYAPIAPIITGGAVINQILDAPFSWLPVDGVYNGFGAEISEIIEACLSGAQSEIPGMYWRGKMSSHPLRGKTELVDNYSPEYFYSLGDRFDFGNRLEDYRMIDLEPIAMLEMTRGCKNNCNFCALNRKRFGCFTRSLETVLAEAYYLAEKGIGRIHIIDPTFGIIRGKTDKLLDGLVNFHTAHPGVKIEVLVRSDMITPQFAEKLAKAGIVKVDMGMESMDDESLNSVSKKFGSRATCEAVEILSSHGIKIKLFHILFPGHISQKTIDFFLELADRSIDFIVQSSFLRKLPTPNSPPHFLEQDQTLFVPRTDTTEQLMEYLLVNLAFPSMDWDQPDLELRKSIRKIFRRGGNLKSLFEFRSGYKCVKIKGGSNKYAYVHPERPDPVNYCIEERRWEG